MGIFQLVNIKMRQGTPEVRCNRRHIDSHPQSCDSAVIVEVVLSVEGPPYPHIAFFLGECSVQQIYLYDQRRRCNSDSTQSGIH